MCLKSTRAAGWGKECCSGVKEQRYLCSLASPEIWLSERLKGRSKEHTCVKALSACCMWTIHFQFADYRRGTPLGSTPSTCTTIQCSTKDLMQFFCTDLQKLRNRAATRTSVRRRQRHCWSLGCVLASSLRLVMQSVTYWVQLLCAADWRTLSSWCQRGSFVLFNGVNYVGKEFIDFRDPLIRACVAGWVAFVRFYRRNHLHWLIWGTIPKWTLPLE